MPSYDVSSIIGSCTAWQISPAPSLTPIFLSLTASNDVACEPCQSLGAGAGNHMAAVIRRIEGRSAACTVHRNVSVTLPNDAPGVLVT